MILYTQYFFTTSFSYFKNHFDKNMSSCVLEWPDISETTPQQYYSNAAVTTSIVTTLPLTVPPYVPLTH